VSATIQDIDKDTIRLSVPARTAYLDIVTEMVTRYATMVGFSEDDLHKISLSVEETFVNIGEHSYVDPETMPTVEISLSVSEPYGLSIRMGDKGIPFDPSRAPAYDQEKAMAEASLSGLGMKLVRGMMDRVEYRNLGRGGKETLLVKYCSGPDSRGGRADASALEDPEEGGEEQGPVEYTVRRLKPEEAIEVSRGAYRSHGYTFFDDVIYYPEKIRALNEQDLMISAVAVTTGNEIMGHAALILEEPGARAGMLDFLFVDPRFRGQNRVGSRITEFNIKSAREKNLAGVYAYAVTVHPISQKVGSKAGLQTSALLLATSPMTWEFKSIAGHLDQRISVVLMYRYVQVPQPRTIYPPERHEEMVRTLYGSLGANHRFGRAETLPPEHPQGTSGLHVEIAEVENNGEIWITRPGSDLAAALRSELRRLCVRGIAEIALFVSLEDGTAARHLELFESMGFFFSGVFPETKIGDVLVLQYLNNIDLDYGSVHVLPGGTEALLRYIRTRDPNQDAQPGQSDRSG
jgi:serine/threonine-protein kinase RsbW